MAIQMAARGGIAATARRRSVPVGRDPLQQPFASNSIWNMPIGSDAVYVNSGFVSLKDAYADPDWYFVSPQIDPDIIILTPTETVTPIELNTDWNGNRCLDMGATLYSVPIPISYVVPDNNMNGCAAILAADGHTIKQNQPFTRCTAGSFATSGVTFPDEDLYEAGIGGSHGGSGLSALGGTIRLGEMRPGMQGPPHALKMFMDPVLYFGNVSTEAAGRRWPAPLTDSAWDAYGSPNSSPQPSLYASTANNTTTAAKMGMLLAIPASTTISSLNLESEPGAQLAWTLQNYGAYAVDSSGYGAGMGMSAETGPSGSKEAEFLSDYGYAMQQHMSRTSINENRQPPNFGAPTPWSRDMLKIWMALKIVDNNTATTIGGGGTPRQSLAPEIYPGGSTAPATPAAPTLTPGNTQITVSWVAPSNGGSPITGYDIQNVNTSAVTSVGVVTSTTITGLTNGTAYTFKVRAINAVGSSAYSTASSSATPAAGGTVAYGSSSALAGNTTATSVVVTKPTSTASGDILLAYLMIEVNPATTITLPSGWTLVKSAANSAPISGQVAWKRAGGSEPANYTFSWTGSLYVAAQIHRFTGAVASGDPFGSSSGSAAAASTSLTIPSLSYTASGAGLGMWMYTASWEGATVTVPSGYTVRNTVAPTSMNLATRTDAAGSLTTGTGTTTNNGAAQVAFAGVLLA